MRSVWLSLVVVVAALPVFLGEQDAAVASPGAVTQVEPPKSDYHLFRPVPRHRMRELSADRPDGTESPITVDPGHFQAEISLVDFTREVTSVRTDTWNVMDLTLKLGLLAQVDLHLGFAAYTIEQTREAGVNHRTHGFGDLLLRLKVNLWGNDGGKTALAILPWVSIPSYTQLSSRHPETGLVTTFAWSIVERLSLGSQVNVSAQWDEPRDRYSLSVEHTLVFGVRIHGPLGVFVEYIGVVNSLPVDNPYIGVFSGGVTLGIGKNMLLDVATQIGLTRAAEDFKVFGGMTFRI